MGFSPHDQQVAELTQDDDAGLTLVLVDDRGRRPRVVFTDVWGYRWQRDVQDVAPGEDDGGTHEVHDSDWVAKLDQVSATAVVGGGPSRHFRIQLNAAGMLDVVCADVTVATADVP